MSMKISLYILEEDLENLYQLINGGERKKIYWHYHHVVFSVLVTIDYNDYQKLMDV